MYRNRMSRAFAFDSPPGGTHSMAEYFAFLQGGSGDIPFLKGGDGKKMLDSFPMSAPRLLFGADMQD